MRLILAILGSVFWITTAAAQGFSGLARVDAAQSWVRSNGDQLSVQLSLSQGVPYRVFTLDAPKRLVLDFQEVDWTGLSRETLITGSTAETGTTDAQFGTYVPGWSRMVLELAQPMRVDAVALHVDGITAAARLEIVLEPVSGKEFSASAGAPHDPRWDLPPPADAAKLPERDPNAPLMIVIDPGHGGIDPGAQVEVDGRKVVEKDLMLQFALELGDLLLRSGQFDVRLTRNDDYFVSLERRIALAHQAKADLFISLHADSLSAGHAHGTTIYTLSKEASDVASAKLAERQERSQLLSGIDLTNTDDVVADVLLDLARVETHPRSETLAQNIAAALKEQGGPMNRRPLRSAGFSVLKSADIPSILLEIGFLSSPRDLKNLLDATWRRKTALGILNGLLAWQADDLARKPLLRQ